MATLTPPNASIPIGWVMAGGRRVPVEIHTEWLRYLVQSLFERSGGTTGSATSDLETAAFEDAGIEDLKLAVARIADELNQPMAVAQTIEESYDAARGLAADLDEIRKRLDALEQR